MSEMEKKLRQNIGGHSIVARKKGSEQPYTHWERDIAHMWPLIVMEATTVTQAHYMLQYEEDKLSPEETQEIMIVLDFICKFHMKFYSEALASQAGAIGSYPMLHEYLDTDRKREVHSVFNCAYVQAVGCYLFTTQGMCLSIPTSLDESLYEQTTAMTLLNNLSDETRRVVVKELQDNGFIPSNANISNIVRATAPYLQIIQDAQDADIAKQKEQAAKKGE
jgi:hypothetical protein